MRRRRVRRRRSGEGAERGPPPAERSQQGPATGRRHGCGNGGRRPARYHHGGHGNHGNGAAPRGHTSPSAPMSARGGQPALKPDWLLRQRGGARAPQRLADWREPRWELKQRRRPAGEGRAGLRGALRGRSPLRAVLCCRWRRDPRRRAMAGPQGAGREAAAAGSGHGPWRRGPAQALGDVSQPAAGAPR